MRFFPASMQSAVRPRLAAEIAPDGVFAAASASVASALDATRFAPVRNESSGGLSVPVFQDRAAIGAALRIAMEAVDPRGRDWTVIVPDSCARVLLLDFDTLPQKQQEIFPLVRFRLRRMIPFDSDTAAVSFQVLKSTNGTGKNGPVQIMAAAMPADVRDEVEALIRETEHEPGTLLPSTIATLAAAPDTGSHLLVHTGQHTLTTTIVRDGELLLYRSTDISGTEPGELGQAILVSAAYYEDTLQKPLEEILVAGFETPEVLRRRLGTDGEWTIPLRSLIHSDVFAADAVPASLPASRYAGVVGALRG
jgi:type IV pilus assembly protein PilM